jgi:tetratricopeptide (TPR) repeat protein
VTAATPLLALLLALSPLQAEHPEVKAGNQALQAGDPAAALPHYQAAEQQAGPHPEIDFDRGHALHQAGRGAEAAAAWKRAAEQAPGPLASKALQNSATQLDAAGDREGAVRALGEALRRDPANEDARYNLEVLLRRASEGKGAPKEPGEKGARRPDGEPKPGSGGKRDRQEAGSKGSRPEQEAGQPQAGSKPEGSKPEQREEQGRRDAGTGPAGDDQARARDGAAGRAEPVARRDAERLLDAMRARERTMPLGPAGQPSTGRKESGRDW